MTAAPLFRTRIEALRGAYPEAAPYLAAYEIALAEMASPTWSAEPAAPGGAPLLAGATLAVKPRAFARFTGRVLEAALPQRTRSAALRALRSEQIEPLALLAAALNHHGERLADLARPFGEAAAAATALHDVLVTPVLQALRGAHDRDDHLAWGHGPCPVCGALPAIVELRGLERRRRLRCGRCGADGEAPAIGCAFCGETDHRRLACLMPEESGESRRVEGCVSCGGYIKTLTTALAWPGQVVRLEDLASMDLDIVAIERGLCRPRAPALSPHASVVAVKEPRLWGLLP